MASDPGTLVVQDQHGEQYEVPVLTVTDVDHPGTGWIIAGSVLAAIGAFSTLAVEGDGGDALGLTYIGMGFGIGIIGGVPYARSKMNASGADLRSGQTLVPGSDMPVRRLNERRAPRGPKQRP